MVSRNLNAEPSTEHSYINVHCGQRMFVAECRITLSPTKLTVILLLSSP